MAETISFEHTDSENLIVKITAEYDVLAGGDIVILSMKFKYYPDRSNFEDIITDHIIKRKAHQNRFGQFIDNWLDIVRNK